MPKRQKKQSSNKKSSNKKRRIQVNERLAPQMRRAPQYLIDSFVASLENACVESALQKARDLTRRHPKDPLGWKALGVVNMLWHAPQEALEPMLKAVMLDPKDAEAHNNLADIQRDCGMLLESLQSCETALSLAPGYMEAYHNQANTLKDLLRYEEAEQGYLQALALQPSSVKSLKGLANLLKDLGRNSEARSFIRAALEASPRDLEALDTLLFILNYDPEISPADLFSEYEAYGETVASVAKHRFGHAGHASVEGRRIRVGYSSPDFRGHVCRFFVEPIFRNHDRDRFELFAYSNTSSPDQHTERMKCYVDHWVDVDRMTDEEMAQRIYDDQIDILVDMAGHTAGNRLPVFAMCPAPIQASSSIGYALTTGLKEVDYFICDENLVPVGSEPYFSELPWRLPAPGYVYEPPVDTVPEVSELPALARGYVTFGSLTRLTRLNDPLLRVWGEILNRVPNSRLRLDQLPFSREGVREAFWRRLEDLGIPRDRVDLTCSMPHWQAYRDIDITLDCWPHNAGTTNLESLWMGVPVLSKLGPSSVGRIGAAVLKPLGLGDWLVDDEESFIQKAVAAASDLGSLRALRTQLRSRLERSALLDAAAFTRNLESAYQAMASNRQYFGTSPKRRPEEIPEQPEEPNAKLTLSPRVPLKEQLDNLAVQYQSGDFREAEPLALALTSEFPQHPFAWKVLGVIYAQTGRLQESVAPMRKCLELEPMDAEAYCNFAIVLQDLARFDEAEASYKQSVALQPDEGRSHYNLGNLLRAQGRLDEAAASYMRSAELLFEPAKAHVNLGNIFQLCGQLDDAEVSYRLAVAADPHLAEAHYNLGLSLQKLSRLTESGECYRNAIALNPNYAEAHNNLASVLMDEGKLEDAEASCRRAIAAQPDFEDAHYNLANALKASGKLNEARASYRQALSINPDSSSAYNNLGNTLQQLGRFEEAEEQYERAVALKPDHADAWNNRGAVLNHLGRFEEAEVCYKKAITHCPDHAEAHNNLGSVLATLGKRGECEASFAKAIQLSPEFFGARSNLLFHSNYDPEISSADLFFKYESYGKAVASMTKCRFEHIGHVSAEGRRIRVGYSSPDFRGHACRFFIEPIFRNHNREQFELFAYSNTSSPDQHTERMKGYFDHWVDVVRMTDEEMAHRIYEDQVDILVDMAGHTKGNRLPVFAMRPAPIQATYFIGFVYTTGLKEVDYFICDENLVPVGSETYFSEQPHRINAPGYVYEPPIDTVPEVSELPALDKGYVTFGSLTRLTRLNDSLLRVWAEILSRVPNSRLRFVRQPFAYEETREMFWKRLEGLGIPRDRVDLTCSNPHWQAYHDIDITLDCWPQNNGTTTLESLWMGVPVLSKIDRPSVGRWGAAALSPLGLTDWLVDDEESFVERAVAAASDLDSLAALRKQLRSRLETSALLDGAAFTRNLEGAYKQMVASVGVSK